jgi:hypothetical protein
LGVGFSAVGGFKTGNVKNWWFFGFLITRFWKEMNRNDWIYTWGVLLGSQQHRRML